MEIKNDYYFGEKTPEYKLANDLMITLEYSGVLSDNFLSYIFSSLHNLLYYIDKKDSDSAKELYKNVNEFLDRYSLFSDNFISRIRRVFIQLLYTLNN
jgi:hypothetical protein